MTDRFTQASTELTDRNPYLYSGSMTTFGHPVIDHDDREHGTEAHPRDAACLLNCDPMPFGD